MGDMDPLFRKMLAPILEYIIFHHPVSAVSGVSQSPPWSPGQDPLLLFFA